MSEIKSPILSPLETRFQLDVSLMDTQHLLEPNQDVFKFTFLPVAMNDYGIVEEQQMNAESKVDMAYMLNADSREASSEMYEDGCLMCSQLFPPKLNFKPEDLPNVPDPLINKTATLQLHLRDSVEGKIYLQCEYLSLYERHEPIHEDITPSEDEIDF